MAGDADIDPRLAIVRELWSTYREEGVERAIPLLHPEVEFIDHTGRLFNGHDGVRGFFAEFRERGEQFTASPVTFELCEPELLVIGHRRIRRGEEVQGDYLFFLHGFRDGRVARLAAHLSREAAFADVEERAGRR